MKKNVLYLMALLVLGGLAYYFVFREEGEVFDKSEANFTVKDTASIKTIFLSNLQNENIKLSKTNGVWKLNDTLVPRQDAITSLLSALTRQKPEQPVSVAYHNSVIKDLSANNTKIEIYTDKGKTNTFYVGKNPGPNNETYMLNDNAKRPYIVKLPLQNTFVGVHYFTKVSDWRSRKILYAAAPVENVNVIYKDSTRYSYKIEKTEGSTNVTGNYVMGNPLNIKRVNDYLKLLDDIYCTGFEDTYIYKDSIVKNGRQLATVDIKRKNQPQEEITLYFKYITQDTKKVIQFGKEEYDYDWFLGLLNKKDFIVLSRKTTEKLLRSFPEFYETDTK